MTDSKPCAIAVCYWRYGQHDRRTSGASERRVLVVRAKHAWKCGTCNWHARCYHFDFPIGFSEPYIAICALPSSTEMRIATWNINSIRRRLPLVLDWLSANKPDVLCLQETKVQDVDFPAGSFSDAGYHVVFRGMKGYNGVATLSRREPESVHYGLCSGPDSEDARILGTFIGGVPIVNTYVPQGYRVGTDKYVSKLEWFHRVRRYFKERLDPNKPAIWLGDLNVAPEPIDVYHSDRRVNDPDFHIDAREAYRHAVSWGFTDVFRRLYPDRVQYTYWDYFRNAFAHNWGWRIDHILATAPLAAACRISDVDLESRRAPGASDHAVIWAEFDCDSQ